MAVNNRNEQTEQQAAALEQTGATMEQLTGAAQSNSAGARHAAELATQASAAAATGGDTIGGMQVTMTRIMESLMASTRVRRSTVTDIGLS